MQITLTNNNPSFTFKKTQIMIDPFFDQTFDLLLDKIGEMNSVLSKYKSKNGETETYKFYDEVRKIMKLAWNTFMDFRQSYHEFENIKLENEFLKARNRELKKELSKYKIVEHLKLTGELDAICAHVDQYLEKRETIKNRQHDTRRD